ncbi:MULTISPECIES: class I SAM-dependent methyltransferase [Arthrobacter]|uniref:Class I SAM-dependent methyltransferase n=2 Tax=Arthrobacter TaxID=1663 RepID=A0ABU9KNM1_9MICC|nr:class I SAM-dependent methyltransferase [Arthrobacter sp. YJM1]MDP5228520.1 class I SAM-dependent methyltransferase [Arthrobacter sp. YJM1]
MGWWTERVVPRMVDRALRGPEVAPYRRTVCGGLHGTVLELGFGSGLNIPYYPQEVQRVLAIEPSDTAWELSAERRARSSIPVERGGRDAQLLDFDDASVDVALSTFTLCTIPDPAAALAEVRRVLRPGGTFHFVEHGRSPDAGVAAWQNVMSPVNTACAGGCHLTRQIDRLVIDAGLSMENLDVGYLAVPAPMSQRYGFVGVARRP